MSKLFDWFKSDAKAPALADMIREGQAKVTELQANVARVVVDAADGVDGAVERYREAKETLARVASEVDLLKAAQAEHEERAARQQAERRRVAHAGRVAEVKADLEASHKHAADLQKHLAAAVASYDKLLATRRGAMDHGLRLADQSETQIGLVRAAVANECYRVGARLNNVSISQLGWPAPVCENGALAGRPDQITPLLDRLKQRDAYTLAQLAEATP